MNPSDAEDILASLSSLYKKHSGSLSNADHANPTHLASPTLKAKPHPLAVQLERPAPPSYEPLMSESRTRNSDPSTRLVVPNYFIPFLSDGSHLHSYLVHQLHLIVSVNQSGDESQVWLQGEPRALDVGLHAVKSAIMEQEQALPQYHQPHSSGQHPLHHQPVPQQAAYMRMQPVYSAPPIHVHHAMAHHTLPMPSPQSFRHTFEVSEREAARIIGRRGASLHALEAETETVVSVTGTGPTRTVLVSGASNAAVQLAVMKIKEKLRDDWYQQGPPAQQGYQQGQPSHTDYSSSYQKGYQGGSNVYASQQAHRQSVPYRPASSKPLAEEKVWLIDVPKSSSWVFAGRKLAELQDSCGVKIELFRECSDGKNVIEQDIDEPGSINRSPQRQEALTDPETRQGVSIKHDEKPNQQHCEQTPGPSASIIGDSQAPCRPLNPQDQRISIKGTPISIHYAIKGIAESIDGQLTEVGEDETGKGMALEDGKDWYFEEWTKVGLH